ncbi:hypothetical protein WJT86_03985 [Microvirga sp. W0021]|uniref:Uncharacterized protein n=1 Tax=Hohaiivirga grylli TaxID=3133970 RepID=A0ABV0BHT7_9HYPH
MSDEEPISRKGMLIGLRIFSLFLIVAGSLYAASGRNVMEPWAAGQYGQAAGAFTGRVLFWLILAIYTWYHSRKYKAAS